MAAETPDNAALDRDEIDPILDQVTSRLEDWFDERSGRDRKQLLFDLDQALLFQTHIWTPRLGGVSEAVLRERAADYSVQRRERLQTLLAQTAVRAQNLGHLHGGRHGSPATAARAAQAAFAALIDPSTRADDATETSIAEPEEPQTDFVELVALWILGRWVADNRQWRPEDAMLAGRSVLDNAKVASDAHQWPGHLDALRQRDFERLLRAEPDALRLIQCLHDSALMMPEEHEALKAAHAAFETRGGECCTTPQALLELVLRPGVPTHGLSLTGMPTQARSFLDTIVEASGRRNDLLVASDTAYIANFVSFSASCLVAALATVGTELGSRWQEDELDQAVRAVAEATGLVRKNAHWRAADAASGLAGEFDGLYIAGQVLFDFQAKAATSTKPVQRDSILDREAHGQHRDAHEALLGPGLTFTRRQKDGSVRRLKPIRRIPENVLMHVPITVGIDPRRAFGIGSVAGDSGLERVVTTVDHLRLVNDVVGPVFRPAYWLDRYFLAHGKRRYIDEVEFLADWLDLLHGFTIRMQQVEGFMLAREHRLGEYLATINQFGPLLHEPEAQDLVRQAKLLLLDSSPENVAPTFNRILKRVCRQGASPDTFALLHSASGVSSAVLERAVTSRQTQVFDRPGQLFDGSYMKWAIWRADRGPRPPEFNGVRLLLVERSGRWSLKCSRDAVAEHWRLLTAGG